MSFYSPSLSHKGFLKFMIQGTQCKINIFNTCYVKVVKIFRFRFNFKVKWIFNQVLLNYNPKYSVTLIIRKIL